MWKQDCAPATWRSRFPEELNRLVTGRLAALHFAPTDGAGGNLLAEGTPAERIFVTGNSGIDAVLFVAGALGQGRLPARDWPWLDGHKLIVVTAHRRESFGDGIERICDALAELARRPMCRSSTRCTAIPRFSTR